MDSLFGKFWNNKEHSRRALYAAFGIPLLGTGDIYLVKKTTDADYDNWLRVMPSANIFGTITLALAACTSGKFDTILIAPGTYSEAVAANKNGVRMIGLGATPHETIISGAGSIALTLTGTNCAFQNLHFTTTGAAIVCFYGTGIVGGPVIKDCHFTQIELTSLACVQIAGATSRGCRITGCNFLGASASADAVNISGKQHHVMNNTAEDLNTTEATCFGVTSYHTGSSNLAV